MGKNVFEMIRDFGGRGKIFEVHFRNVTGPLPHFVETFPDDGYMDMYQVMKTLAPGAVQRRRGARSCAKARRRQRLIARGHRLLHLLHAGAAPAGE